MIEQLTLETPRLRLRPLELSDASIKIIEFLLKKEEVFPLIKYPIEDTIKSYLENVFLKENVV